MDESLSRGSATELHGILAFEKLGYYCSIPFNGSCRYDFVVDLNGKLLRIQAKSSRYYDENNTSFIFNGTRSTTNTHETKRYTYSSDEIDYFYTHFLGYDFLVPVEEVSTNKILRLKKGIGNNLEQINVASDYLLEKVVKEILSNKAISKYRDYCYISKDLEGNEVEWSREDLSIYSERQMRYIKECCKNGKMAYGKIWKVREFPEL